jgi:hypothetical protein
MNFSNFFFFFCLFILSHSANASDCTLSLESDVNLHEPFPGRGKLLQNQKILFSRQENKDWVFVEKNGTITPFAPPAGSTTAYTELSNHLIALTSKDGHIHLLDQSLTHQSEFATSYPRFFWHMTQRKDGVIALLTNRTDDEDIYSSVIFINPDGINKNEVNIGKSGIFSEPVVLPDDSVALKSNNNSVFIVKTSGKYLNSPVLGSRGTWLLKSFSDGTLISGGHYSQFDKLFLIDPNQGTINYEMNWENNIIKQSLSFLKVLSNDRLIIGFSILVKDSSGSIHFNERLELYDRKLNKISEFSINDPTGASIYESATELPDGSIIYPAGNHLFSFDQNLNFQAVLDLHAFVPNEPIIMKDGTIVLTGSTSTNGVRESHLFYINRTCSN